MKYNLQPNYVAMISAYYHVICVLVYQNPI